MGIEYKFSSAKQNANIFKFVASSIVLSTMAFLSSRLPNHEPYSFDVLFFGGLAAGAALLAIQGITYSGNPHFLFVEKDGITLRYCGHIPWKKIQKISFDGISMVFQFTTPDQTQYKAPLFDPFKPRFKRKGNNVLVSFPTDLIGLEDASGVKVWLFLQCHYAGYLDSSKTYDVDKTPVGAIDETIAKAKDGIKFSENYDDVIKNFELLQEKTPQ